MATSDSSSNLIRQLLVEYEGKRMKMKKGAEGIFHDIKTKIGTENIEKIIVEALKDNSHAKEKTALIMKLFEQKTVKKVDKSSDFRSFLKQ